MKPIKPLSKRTITRRRNPEKWLEEREAMRVKYAERYANDPEFREKEKRRAADRQRERFQSDPKYREKIRKGHRKFRERRKKDPAWVEK